MKQELENDLKLILDYEFKKRRTEESKIGFYDPNKSALSNAISNLMNLEFYNELSNLSDKSGSELYPILFCSECDMIISASKYNRHIGIHNFNNVANLNLQNKVLEDKINVENFIIENIAKIRKKNDDERINASILSEKETKETNIKKVQEKIDTRKIEYEEKLEKELEYFKKNKKEYNRITWDDVTFGRNVVILNIENQQKRINLLGVFESLNIIKTTYF